MIFLLLLLLFLTPCVSGTFVVNVTQTSSQAEENQNITLEWTFSTRTDTSLKSISTICQLYTESRSYVLFHLNDGVESPESQDPQFSGRVQWDKDVLTEGRLTLHVSRLRTNDSGFYVCAILVIPDGSNSRSCWLNVTETLPFTIQVYFSPMAVLETSEGSFICETEANPPVNFAWSRNDLLWPQSAVREGAVLRFKDMTSDLNGLYKCEAFNQHGSKQQQLYVYVASGNSTSCWVLFSLLFILCVAAVAAAGYLSTSGRIQWSGDRQPVPTNSPPPEEGEFYKNHISC